MKKIISKENLEKQIRKLFQLKEAFKSLGKG